MPQLSVMIHTASRDHFLQTQGVTSYFQAVIDCLTAQTLKDIELVYVDTYHEDNQHTFRAIYESASFPVKHVPIHPEHRYWFDRGNTYISAAKNTGIIHADGELLVTFDDAEFFPETLLQSYWDTYQTGVLLHGFHKRLRSVETENGRLKLPVSGDVYVNDSRASKMRTERELHRTGNWMYAGTSFPLTAALKLNGFNERMDANKSLEDSDFGFRLVMAGYRFVLDKSHFMYICDHPSYVDSERRIKDFIAIENHGMLCCGRELFEPIANKGPITDRHKEIIRRETLKYRGFDPLPTEDFQVWLGTPTFDLKAQRAELRRRG